MCEDKIDYCTAGYNFCERGSCVDLGTDYRFVYELFFLWQMQYASVYTQEELTWYMKMYWKNIVPFLF